MTEHHQIPDNPYLGTEATVQHMLRIANDGSKDPSIIELARGITRDLPNKDYVAELEAIFLWVKKHVRYVRDPWGLETLATPKHTALVSGVGDCDEHATLIAALARAIGHRAGFRCVQTPGSYGFSHVYALVGPGNNDVWYAADTTAARASFGWDPADVLGLHAKDWYL